jgi:hypothetical protein
LKSSSARQVSEWPFIAAQCKGVRWILFNNKWQQYAELRFVLMRTSHLSSALTSALKSSSARQISVWPFSAAQCNGVLWSLLNNQRETHEETRFSAERKLHMSRALTSALKSSSARQVSEWPFSAAQCNGVLWSILWINQW